MKNTVKCATLAILLASPLALAQSAPVQDWEAEVRQFDTSFWDAYNQCDIKKLVDLNTDDLEFYHDKGGLMVGKAKVRRGHGEKHLRQSGRTRAPCRGRRERARVSDARQRQAVWRRDFGRTSVL